MARAALAIAPVVVHAMLAGIGITIALQQIMFWLCGTSHSHGVAGYRSVAGRHPPSLKRRTKTNQDSLA